MFVYFGIIAFMIAVQGSDGQESCSTAFGSQGLCISIYRCPYILRLIQLQLKSSPPESEELTLTIQNSQCGYERNIPKVCCPEENQVEASSNPFPSGLPDPPDVKNHSNIRLLEEVRCGMVIDPKIDRGIRAGLSEFPWMALIAYNVGGNGLKFKCEGTLINKRYVLTAAHCVTGLKSGIVLAGVRVGDHYLDREVDCEVENEMPNHCAEKYQNFFIENIHVHSEYRRRSNENDIALIRLDGDVNFEAVNVKPICLPYGDSAILTSTKVALTGWDKTQEHPTSEGLLKVTLDILSNDECARAYSAKHGLSITYKQLCAAEKNHTDYCVGDSGGPLQHPAVINRTSKYIQYGVLSFAPEECGDPRYPGVYTKVAYYMDWILDTIVE